MKEYETAETKMQEKLNIVKFPLNATKYYELDKSCDWVRALLLELNEKADEKKPEEYLANTDIKIQMEIKKLFKSQYGEFLIINLQFSSHYVTQCVRTLEEMEDSLHFEVNSCFLDREYEKLEEFEDQMEIYEDNQLNELYFYEKGFVDVKEMIHEQIFLNINQYPVKNSDSELNWAKETSELKQ